MDLSIMVTSRETKEICEESKMETDLPLVIADANFSGHLLAKKKTLAVQSEYRNLFFNKNNLIEALLKESALNPMLEDHYFAPGLANKCKGEYFINPPAFLLLVSDLIKKYNNRNNTLRYNTRHILVINNNIRYLCDLLKTLNLTAGEDYKIIFILEQHAIAVYLKYEEDRMRCYISDSLGTSFYALLLVKILKFTQVGIDIIIGPELQKDEDNCSTFAIKSLMYFIKKGSTLFSYLNTIELTVNFNARIRTFKLANLMPALLKLSQYKTEFKTGTLSAIVSVKQNLSLHDYQKFHHVTIAEKNYNAALLRKKYGYFSKLDSSLRKQLPSDLTVSSEVKVSAAIHPVIKPYYIESSVEPFVNICLEINEYLEKRRFHLSLWAAINYHDITTRWPDFAYLYTSPAMQAINRGRNKEENKLYYLLILCYATDSETETLSEVFSSANKTVDFLINQLGSPHKAYINFIEYTQKNNIQTFRKFNFRKFLEEYVVRSYCVIL